MARCPHSRSRYMCEACELEAADRALAAYKSAVEWLELALRSVAARGLDPGAALALKRYDPHRERLRLAVESLAKGDG